MSQQQPDQQQSRSFWLDAPREGFTDLAWTEWERMRKSSFSTIGAIYLHEEMERRKRRKALIEDI
jgi:hypothetical protein